MMAAPAVTDTEGDLIVHREGSAGIIRLNRPKAINAMTLEMSLGIDAALVQPLYHVDVIDAVKEAGGDFLAGEIGRPGDRAISAHQQPGIVRRTVVNVHAGSEEHQIEAVAARHHGFEDGAAADLGAAAEHRFDCHGALRHVGPGHGEVLVAEITLVACHDERREIGDRQRDNADRRRRRLVLRRCW